MEMILKSNSLRPNTNTESSLEMLNTHRYNGEVNYKMESVGHQISVSRIGFQGHAETLTKPKEGIVGAEEWNFPELPQFPPSPKGTGIRSLMRRVTPQEKVNYSVERVLLISGVILQSLDYLHNRLHGEMLANIYVSVSDFVEYISDTDERDRTYVSQATDLRTNLGTFFASGLNNTNHEKSRYTEIFRVASRELKDLDDVLSKFYQRQIQ